MGHCLLAIRPAARRKEHGMTATAASSHLGRIPGWIASLSLLWLTWNSTPAWAQVSPIAPAPPSVLSSAPANSIGTDEAPEATPAPPPAPLTPVKAEFEQPM